VLGAYATSRVKALNIGEVILEMHAKLVCPWFFLSKLFTRLVLVVKCMGKIMVLMMVKLRQKWELVPQLRQKREMVLQLRPKEMRRKTMAHPLKWVVRLTRGEKMKKY
jgi:hypothetical protein